MTLTLTLDNCRYATKRSWRSRTGANVVAKCQTPGYKEPLTYILLKIRSLGLGLGDRTSSTLLSSPWPSCKLLQLVLATV